VIAGKVRGQRVENGRLLHAELRVVGDACHHQRRLTGADRRADDLPGGKPLP
jgi:hypothetical protein